MENSFAEIVSEFEEQLNTYTKVINFVQNVKDFKRTEKSAVFQSFYLLLAATFEAFVCQMACETGRCAFNFRNSRDELPRELLNLILEQILSKKLMVEKNKKYTKESFSELSKNINSQLSYFRDFLNENNVDYPFDDVIKNRRNMNANQINEMFKICGISNICDLFCGDKLLDFFVDFERHEISAKFRLKLNEFIINRNELTHSFRNNRIIQSEELIDIIEFFIAVANDLLTFLSSRNSYQIK